MNILVVEGEASLFKKKSGEIVGRYHTSVFPLTRFIIVFSRKMLDTRILREVLLALSFSFSLATPPIIFYRDLLCISDTDRFCIYD